jgi:apolipoprotein D and lipocalin family protein
MRSIFTLLLCALALPAWAAPPLQTVPQVDLNRYLGTWYEIANYPTFFQSKDCVGTTAQYSLLPDGHIRVRNTCYPQGLNQPASRIEGRAWVADTTSNAKLKVQFFPPFAGDYWVIDLDPGYQWAVVGHPSRNFLWILSRTPMMSPDIYHGITTRLQQQGYDLTRIVRTPSLGASQARAQLPVNSVKE